VDGLLPKTVVSRALEEWGVHTTALPKGLSPEDDRLDPLTNVVGVEVSGRARAYPLAAVAERGAVDDEIHGAPVRVTLDPARDRVDVSVDGSPATFRRTRWVEWSEFHPSTSL
jgi:hypothetical protein